MKRREVLRREVISIQIDEKVKSKLKKDAKIYKRTKKRRIKKKVLKRIRECMFDELDRLIELEMKNTIDQFSTVTFENGSRIDLIQSDNIARGNRSKYFFW